jgi:hypothetical protein
VHLDFETEEEIVDIKQLPISLIVHSRSKVSLYRMNRAQEQQGPNSIDYKQLLCDTQGHLVDQVEADKTVPSIFLALSKQSNSVLVFEAKGRGQSAECSLRGSL